MLADKLLNSKSFYSQDPSDIEEEVRQLRSKAGRKVGKIISIGADNTYMVQVEVDGNFPVILFFGRELDIVRS